jgi:hypothetical protein
MAREAAKALLNQYEIPDEYVLGMLGRLKSTGIRFAKDTDELTDAAATSLAWKITQERGGPTGFISSLVTAIKSVTGNQATVEVFDLQKDCGDPDCPIHHSGDQR